MFFSSVGVSSDLSTLPEPVEPTRVTELKFEGDEGPLVPNKFSKNKIFFLIISILLDSNLTNYAPMIVSELLDCPIALFGVVKNASSCGSVVVIVISSSLC